MKHLFTLVLLLSATLTRADTPGQFDYYVLALSWSPQYCADERRENEMQCQRPYGFVAHGLWPQHADGGWPENCGRGAWVDEPLIERMLPYMPSRKLILHEWRKHGVCSGLSPAAYFAAVEKAFQAVRLPPAYVRPAQPLRRTLARLEADFQAANPALSKAAMAWQCRKNQVQELRLCLTRDLQSRACGADVRDTCTGEVLLRPSR